jgi:hypothetical protein
VRRDHEKLINSGSSSKKLRLFLAALFVYTIFVVAFPHHVDHSPQPDCIFCRFADSLAATDTAEPPFLTPPVFLKFAFISYRGTPFHNVVISQRDSRSPPFVI